MPLKTPVSLSSVELFVNHRSEQLKLVIVQ